MPHLIRNAENAKLFQEILERDASTSAQPVTTASSGNAHAQRPYPDQASTDAQVGLLQSSHGGGDVPGEALNIWNLRPRSPRTPVRERHAQLQLPPLVAPGEGSQFVFFNEPQTPCPKPRKERLPAPNSLSSEALEHWFHTGVWSEEPELGDVGGEVEEASSN